MKISEEKSKESKVII